MGTNDKCAVWFKPVHLLVKRPAMLLNPGEGNGRYMTLPSSLSAYNKALMVTHVVSGFALPVNWVKTSELPIKYCFELLNYHLKWPVNHAKTSAHFVCLSDEKEVHFGHSNLLISRLHHACSMCPTVRLAVLQVSEVHSAALVVCDLQFVKQIRPRLLIVY